jgi:hypothetical protein
LVAATIDGTEYCPPLFMISLEICFLPGPSYMAA